MEEELKPVVWVSIASETGFSVLSLGKMGLRGDSIDDQVFTGGLTAVESLIGVEVGIDEDRFIGGSSIHKTGRFKVKRPDGKLIGQFLIVSPEKLKIPDSLIDFYENLVSIFAEKILDSNLIPGLKDNLISELGTNDFKDLYISSIEAARKKKKIPHDQSLLVSNINNLIHSYVDSYKKSTVLSKVAGFKGNYEYLVSKIRVRKDELLIQLIIEMADELIEKFPHSLVMYPNIKYKTILSRVESSLKSVLDPKQLQKAFLENLFDDFKAERLEDFINEFSLFEISHETLYEGLQKTLYKEFLKKYPLLLLLKPEIDDFSKLADNFAKKIVKDFDFGGTLSKIATKNINGKFETELVNNFLRNFCMRFPGGLPSAAWNYIVIFFKLLSLDTKTKIETTLKSFENTDEVVEDHLKAIKKNLEEYAISQVDPPEFVVHKGSDVIPFFRGLRESIARSLDELMISLIVGDKPDLNIVSFYQNSFYEFGHHIKHINSLFNAYSYLENIEGSLKTSFDYIAETDLLKILGQNKINISDIKSLNIHQLSTKILVDTFIERLAKSYREEYLQIEHKLNKLETLYKNQSQSIKANIENNQRIRPNNPKNELKILTDPLIIGTNKSIDIQKTSIENTYDKLESEINKYNDLLSSDDKDLRKIQNSISKSVDKTFSELLKVNNKFKSKYESDYNNQIKSLNNKMANPITKKLNKTSKESWISAESSKKPIDKLKSIYFKGIDKQFISAKTCAKFYFYTFMNDLPGDIRTKIIDELTIGRDNFPLLKEAKKSFKTEKTDFFTHYKDLLEEQSRDKLHTVFTSLIQETMKGITIRKNPDVDFLSRGRKVMAGVKLGSLNERAAQSFKSILPTYIEIRKESSSHYDIYALINPQDVDLKSLKSRWEGKDWQMKQFLVTLFWNQLLTNYTFIYRLLDYSSGLYSKTAKKAFDDIFHSIEEIFITEN